MQDDLDIKVFLCPFNPYHKLYDFRKHQFHIARCKDRRGKSLFHCRYHHSHTYTSVHELLQHELTCERKPIKLEDELTTTEELEPLQKDEERLPSVTYCKYSWEHAYKTIPEREMHEKTCPNRVEMEFKMS